MTNIKQTKLNRDIVGDVGLDTPVLDDGGKLELLEGPRGSDAFPSLADKVAKKHISPHPNCEKLAIPEDLVAIHKKQVEEAGLAVNIRFVTMLLTSFQELVVGSRSDLAAKMSSLGTIVLKITYPISVGEGLHLDYLSYTFSGIISSGGLLLSMAYHPTYYLPDPAIELQKLVNIMIAIEQVLSEKIKENFSKQLRNSLDRNFSTFQKMAVDPTLKGNSATWLDFLSKLVAFEMFVIFIQKGATISAREIKVESLLVPGVCFQSSSIFKWLEPILKKEGWTLRVFARALNPFIFYFAFKNKVPGYLTRSLEQYLPESDSKNYRSFYQALMSEVDSNNPFLSPAMKAVLEMHQNKVNQKKRF